MKNLSQRRTEAKERSEEYNKLSTTQKILMLDLRFGENKGARRQRSRLALEAIQEANSKETLVQGNQKSHKKNYQKPKKS